MMPGSSGVTAACSTRRRPLTATEAATMPVASMSRPTRVLVRLAMGSGEPAVGVPGCLPLIGTYSPFLSRDRASPTCVHGRLARGQRSERVQVGVDQLVADEEADDAPEGQERPERHRGLAALHGALAGDDRGADEHAGDERD